MRKQLFSMLFRITYQALRDEKPALNKAIAIRRGHGHMHFKKFEALDILIILIRRRSPSELLWFNSAVCRCSSYARSFPDEEEIR